MGDGCGGVCGEGGCSICMDCQFLKIDAGITSDAGGGEAKADLSSSRSRALLVRGEAATYGIESTSIYARMVPTLCILTHTRTTAMRSAMACDTCVKMIIETTDLKIGKGLRPHPNV